MGHALVQVRIAIGLVQGMEQLLGLVTIRRFERLAQAGFGEAQPVLSHGN
jgi:hypothetical protein